MGRTTLRKTQTTYYKGFSAGEYIHFKQNEASGSILFEDAIFHKWRTIEKTKKYLKMIIKELDKFEVR